MSAPQPRREIRVEGRAQRRVTPDVAAVHVAIRTARCAASPEAMAEAIAARERLRARIDERLDDVEVVDQLITVQQESGQKETRRGQEVQTEWVIVGYVGVGAITLRAPTPRAAALVSAVADHPDAASVWPTFELAPDTETAIRDELQCAALEDAGARARRLAAVVDETTAEVTLIDTAQSSGGLMYDAHAKGARTADAGGGEEMTELAPQGVDLEVTISAHFALARRDA